MKKADREIDASAGAAASPVRAVWVDLLLYPGHTLPTAAAPVVVSAGLALRDGVFAPAPLFVAFLASWLVHVGGVFADNFVLLWRHRGIPEHPELLAALDNGSLKLPTLMAATLLCFAAAIATGPWLMQIAGTPVVALGGVGIVASLGYSVGGPLSLTRLGIADVVFLAMFGVVAPAGAYFVAAAATRGAVAFGSLPPEVFLAGLPVGAIVANVLLIDDIRDREFDALKGWRTRPVRYGVAFTRREFAALMAFAYASPVALWLGLGTGAWTLAPLVSLPEAYVITRTVLRTSRFEDLHPMTPRTARLSLVFAVLLAAGLALR
jgi:1,4-dihydroxy-2-naphthoate polyprenyltransferase